MRLIALSSDVSLPRSDHPVTSVSTVSQTIPKNTNKVRAGKVSAVNLPQEYHLARLTENAENKHASWSTDTPACKWEGIKCNEQGEVEYLFWVRSAFSGILHFDHLPRSLTGLRIYNTKFKGEAALSSLPKGLVDVFVTWNEFSGPLDLTSLPAFLVRLSLNDNKFTGGVCLTKLPETLQELRLADNSLTGSVDVTALSPVLRKISLQNNAFSGLVDFSRLPPTLEIITLGWNKDLRGTVKRSEISTRLRYNYNFISSFYGTKIEITN